MAIEKNPSFVIQSTRPGGRLAFRWTRPSFMEVVLEDVGLRAVTEVHAIVSGPADLPTAFFDVLGEGWRGWRGTKDWASYEGDLKLSASADGRGHVFLRVNLDAGASDDQWRARAVLVVEAGQLEGYSKEFRLFSAAQRAA